MASKVLKTWIISVLFIQFTDSQEIASNTLGDFVKGLTKLISDNGGLGSLVNALPRPGSPHYGEPQQYPGYAPSYPQGSYDEEQGPYRPQYRPPPPHQYRPRPPAPGYYPPPGHYPPPALPPGLYPLGSSPLYPQQGFLAALDSIARHDDLRCVPRLLCEVTSGGKPGYPSYTQGQQTTRDTITSLLTVLNFMDDNPLLTFGRAALLGAASRGKSEACLNAYPTCPRDPDRLVHYLNNHHGGFFRFFGGLPGQQRGNQNENVATNDVQDTDKDVTPEDGEARIQNRPSFQISPAVHYPTRQPQSLSINHFQQSSGSHHHLRPAEAQDYLPVSAHGDHSGSGDRFVFPSDDRTSPYRSGKHLAFPQDSGDRPGYQVQYKPDFSPPQNLVNFRDQRAVKFPGSMNFPKF